MDYVVVGRVSAQADGQVRIDAELVNVLTGQRVAGPFFVGSSANLTGGYLYASYFLTGEHRIYERTGQHGAQFGRNVPINNFFAVPGCCGTGAWELKARVSYLDMSDIDRGTYHDFTGGFNWYWNERIRLMFDWIHPITSSETVFGATSSDLIATRMDFSF